MAIKDTIFEEWFSYLDALTDANKNVDNKGTLQRFVESLAQDIDDNIKPFLDDSFTNLVNPRTMLDKYLSLRENELGNDVLFFGSSITNRRKIIEGWHRFVSIKGTKRAYDLFFDMLDLTYTITEIFNDSGFDSPFLFDSNTRPVFDSGRCAPCTFYIIELTGSPLTDELLQTIFNIIEFNQPINAKLGVLRYNGVDIINIIPVGLLAGWDTANDGTLDTNAIAEFLGDPSGTFRSYQYIKNTLGDSLTTGTVTLTLTGVYKYSGAPDELLGTFTGTIADLFSDSGFWVTSFNIYDYFGLTDQVGDSQQITFTKLLYANAYNKKNINTQEIRASFMIDIPPSASSIPRILTLGSGEIEGTYSSPFSISISQNDDKFYVGEFANAGKDISQALLDRNYTTRSFATTNSINEVRKIKVNTDLNAFGDLLYTQSNELWFAKGVSDDVDGFTVFGTPTKIGGNYFSSGRAIEILDDVVNGEKVLLSSGGGLGGTSYSFFTYEWDGVSAWNFVGVPGGGVFNSAAFGNINTALGNIKKSGNTLFLNYYYNLASQLRGVAAVSYTGDYKIVGNWSRININLGFTVTPDLGGVSGARGIWVDDVNLVNGYPVIYLANFTYHVIQKITANKVDPLIESDFDTVIIAGTYNVAGNADGIGTAATFTAPFDLDGKDGILYVTQSTGGNNIRAINLSTLEVTDYKGQFGITSQTEYEEY